MKVIIVLFDNFETLDVFGPVEILGRLPEHFQIDYYSIDGGIKTSTQGVSISTGKLTGIDIDNESGISAGMDMTLGFVNDILSTAYAERIAVEMEYEWNNNPDDDKFAK